MTTLTKDRRKELRASVAKQWKLAQDRFGPTQKQKLNEEEAAFINLEFERVFHYLWADLGKDES